MIIRENKKKIIIDSVSVKHGKVNSICYIIDKKLAYISDVSEIKRSDYNFSDRVWSLEKENAVYFKLNYWLKY